MPFFPEVFIIKYSLGPKGWDNQLFPVFQLAGNKGKVRFLLDASIT